MPSKPKETLTEKVLRLEAEVKSKNLQIAALNRTPKRKGRKLIPRPEGQAGRAYNVQKKMGLQKDKDRFCRLSRILRSYTFKYLDPHKTIRKQEPARVEKLLKLIMKQFKLFSRFQGGWPAYDLIKKVLQNSVRSLKADRAAEALAEEEDSDSEEGADEPTSPTEKKPSSKRSKRATSSDSESSDDDDISWSDNEPEEENSAAEEDDESEEEPKRVASGKKSKIVETADAKKQKTTGKKVDGSKQGKKKKDDAAEPQKHKRAPLAEGEPEKKTVAGTKRKTAPDQEIEPGGSKKKVRVSDSVPLPPPTQSSKSKPKLQNLEIPTTCPICPDSLPEGNLSVELRRLFLKRQKILLTPGHQARQLEQIDGDICGQITWEQKQDHLRRIGRKNGWPLSLDFNSIITQILQHESEILDLVSDEYELSKNLVWAEFLHSIDGRIHEFGGEEDPENYEYAKLRARCGYLGPQGAHLILSTICRIFAHSFADLRTKLSITVDRLIARQPKDFDHPQSSLRPALVLPIEHFIEFVLIPHVAVCLIAEDMEVSYENALDIKDASADFGDMFHWDINTAQVQDLDQANIDAVGDRSLPTTPERASPRIKKTSTHPKDSPTLFSPTSPLKRADFDSPAEGSRKYKKLRFEDPPSIAKIAPTVELTLEDFPPRKSKTKAKKTHDKKSVGKDQVQPDEAETSGRRYSTRSSTKSA